MRKYLIAASVAATLLAGQAMASESDVNVGDRDASSSATASDMTGMSGETTLFLLAGGLLIGLVAYYASNSESPTSP